MMQIGKTIRGVSLLAGLIIAIHSAPPNTCLANEGDNPIWLLAQRSESTFRFSTLFTAQAVHSHFKTDADIDRTIQWCKETGITRIFIETFRDGFDSPEENLLRGRDRFRQAGFAVSGCVTPTGMGVASNGWKAVSNYEKEETRAECKRIFQRTANYFDEIMIDDFLFTDDTSESSIQARGDRSWADYRCDLMLRISRECILGPAREVNPKVEIIIKYPQWYDLFHERGYNVLTETDLYDRIWVGTETRDPDNSEWGRKAQYEAFYIMQWLTEIGAEKCGGGWFDSYGTSPETYVEQARQTILGGAKEALLFNYHDLIQDRYTPLVKALRAELPALFELAQWVSKAKPKGILAPKIPNSHAGQESYIYDFLGMLGLPLVPLSRIDTSYPCALFASQSWQDDIFPTQLDLFLDEGKPVLLTHHLKEICKTHHLSIPDSVPVISIPDDPRDLYQLEGKDLEAVRAPLLQALGMEISGPTRVALYLYDNDVIGVENFRDEPIQFSIRCLPASVILAKLKNDPTLLALPSSDSVTIERKDQTLTFHLKPRSLGVIRFPAQ